jgi:monoamine oxidase
MRTFDVVVLGAGAAGLAAARALRASGRSVAVLEARERIGGRIMTDRSLDFPVPIELGAEFVHGEARSIWTKLEAAHLATITAARGHFSRRNGRFEPMVDLGTAGLAVLSKEDAEDASVAERLARAEREGKLTPDQVRSAVAFVEGFDAAPAGEISARVVAVQQRAADEIHGDRAHRVLEGYDALLRWCAAGLDPAADAVLVDHVVTRLKWSRGSVEVHTQNAHGTEREPIGARRAIVTLPVGVLHARAGERGAVEFAPELPEWKRQAAGSMRMGHVVKMVLRLREPFWREKGLVDETPPSELGFVHASGTDFPVWWTTEPVRAPMLTAWAAGPAADALRDLDEASLRSRAATSFARAFGAAPEEAFAQITALRRHDWRRDPFARGAYAYVPVGCFDAIAALAQPVESTLFFAGEATHEAYAGTVHGALESGVRAADQVLGRGSDPSSL